ncbi:agmatinase [Rhodopila sp.]|uniref:agmatinase n=1 Tax=Rhodopila sp. TaxID=2480087 RepID=UPI002C72DC31|nr:agmatinase [Rhodopila sp.]HVZ09818.1 agmatinase [Rhodopila sp.]
MAAVPTFAVSPSFLGIARTDPTSDFVIAGIPMDIGTTNRAGTREGPAAIRRASRMLTDGEHPVHRVAPDAMPIADIGDFTLALGDIPGSLGAIARQAEPLSHLIALGGEHGVTLPLLRALTARLGRKVALVHFDAHVDTWPDNFGQAYAHGSPFYHAIREGLVEPARMIQIGIRSPVQNEVMDWTLAQGVAVVSAQDVHAAGPAAIARRITDCVGDAPAYLSFDIDALDPAFAPGTGTPEVGGLASWQAQAILRRLDGVSFIGMDMVEVAPAYDVSEITALAAATMVWEYLALQAVRARRQGPGR